MTPEAAIDSFLSGFGIPAYASTSTPDEGDPDWQGFPYLTYGLAAPEEWGGFETNIAVSLWFMTDSEAQPNAKAREIGRAIGMGGVTLPCDGGIVWLKNGSPRWQAVRVEGENPKIKRRLLNITCEYAVTGY